ncbi:MAG: hypothetical protein JRI26_07010, partial [Deltaproteobacteria bacterium]|nr:hypothetical protein [Deltaproteobacteria bacterium]
MTVRGYEKYQENSHPAFAFNAIYFPYYFSLACGEGVYSSSETGSIAFSVEFQGVLNESSVLSQAIDCGSSGIATVEAKVYDENDSYLIGGGPWNCEAHSGTITGVPAGLNRKVVILGKDSSGDVLYRGEVTGVTVTAGQTSSSGTIIAEPFQTTPLGPADSSTVTKGAFSFEWSSITGAAEYRIWVATDSSLINLIIDTTTTGATYTPSGLSYDTTYYWEVYPIDSYGNEGAGSGVWSF